MSRDPVRWRDGASDAPAGAKRWLESVPRPQRLPAAEIARAAALAETVSAAARTSSGASLGGKWLWLVGGVSAMMIAATVALTWAHHAAPSNVALAGAHRMEPVSTSVRVAPVVQPAPIEPPVAVIAPAEQPLAPAIAIEPTPIVARAARASHHVNALVDHGVTTAPVETAPSTPDPCPAAPLMREACETGALATLLARDPQAALSTADAIAHEFPFGTMAPEREYFAFEALQRLGRTEEARTRGERLIARFPHSTPAARVQRALSQEH